MTRGDRLDCSDKRKIGLERKKTQNNIDTDFPLVCRSHQCTS